MSLYFIAVEPDAELSSEVRHIQQDFKMRFGSSKALANFPHITIIPPFHNDENFEESLINKFQTLFLKLSPFEIQLDGFGIFANKKNPVVFIKPVPSPELNYLQKRYSDELGFELENYHPHLTVAYKDLSFSNFTKAWKEYRTGEFSESFIVDKIHLYRHKEGSWKSISIKNLKKS